ncbi:MAG: copper homeostasis protein CutC [Oscillospiraceae bacterium]|nr:copper homeostasis protein CutC [Oscillospiraceae bacterium]
MRETVLEVCVDSVESAIAAEKGGATRLELCANLIIGGTTPSVALFDAVRAAVDIPINVLIRPRFGDFLYTDAEYDIMCREIELFAARGANAVVIGALNADGTLDREKMRGMIAAANGVRVTMHRAFDVCQDAFATLEEALELGVDTILTSGQKANAWEGRELIGRLMEKAGDRADILVGAGVSAAMIGDFRREYPAARAFHLSGKTVLDSGMTYRNEEVSMGLPGISEFQVWRTEEEAIRRAKEALTGLV